MAVSWHSLSLKNFFIKSHVANKILLPLLTICIVSLVGLIDSAYAILTVNFYTNPAGESWQFTNHGLEVEVIDTVGNPAVVEARNIDLLVQAGSSEFCRSTFTFYESAADSNRYYITPTGSGYINITSVNITPDCDNTALKLQAADGNKINATEVGSSIALRSANVINPDNWGTSPTSDPNKQPDTSVKLTCTNDADKDKVCDEWEDQGDEKGLEITRLTATYIYYCKRGSLAGVSGDPAYTLGTQQNPDSICPTTSRNDTFVEIDWLKGHGPSQTAINDVNASFIASLYPQNLHVQANEEIQYHDTWLGGPSNGNPATGTEFDNLKNATFGLASERVGSNAYVKDLLTAKRQVFHYGIFGHFQGSPSLKLSSGVAEDTGGNDFLVTLGSFTGAVGSRMEQAGTFMHELGHNMNLNHGGQATTPNCEPNYLSIMSWSRQFTTLVWDRDLDYSRETLPTITEAPGSINEITGIQTIVIGESTVWGKQNPPGYIVGPATASINFDSDTDSTITINDGNPFYDLNKFSYQRITCDGVGASLTGYNDWMNLWYNVTKSSTGVNNFGD